MIATIFRDAKGQGKGRWMRPSNWLTGKSRKVIDVPYQLITKENMSEFVSRNQNNHFWLSGTEGCMNAFALEAEGISKFFRREGAR